MLVSPAMTTGCLPPRLRAVAYIYMRAQNAARPAHGEQPACGPWTLMRVRPPPSVRISRATAFPGTISVKLSTSCSATYLLLTAVRRPPPLEVEAAPVSASRFVYLPGRQTARSLCRVEPWYVVHMLAYALELNTTICRIAYSIWLGARRITKIGLKTMG